MWRGVREQGVGGMYRFVLLQALQLLRVSRFKKNKQWASPQAKDLG